MSRPARKRHGPLVIISAMMIASAVLRVGEGAGRALALQASPTAEPALCLPNDTPEVLAALKQREERLARSEAALADRMQALNVAEGEARKRLEQLEAAERSLAATIAQADTAGEGDLTRLTQVYQSMKPKDAAALFEEMSPDFAAGFLGRMQPDAAAAIMAGLTPRTAYAFSVLLAGRNASAPKE